MAGDESEYEADGNCIEEKPLQGTKKILFCCDCTEEMNLIRDAAILDAALRMIDCTTLELRDLHLGICPDRRRDAAALHGLDGREMVVRVKHNAARTVCDPHDNAGDDRPLEPELCLCCIAAFDIAHHVMDAAVKIDLCLPIKIDIRANPQNRRRENEHEKEDCRVQ